MTTAKQLIENTINEGSADRNWSVVADHAESHGAVSYERKDRETAEIYWHSSRAADDFADYLEDEGFTDVEAHGKIVTVYLL